LEAKNFTKGHDLEQPDEVTFQKSESKESNEVTPKFVVEEDLKSFELSPF